MRPKWQHPDAAVRAAAMATLDDQSLLAQIVEQDESDAVRLAALQRLTDQSALARIARSNSPFSAHAFGGITDHGEILALARTAELPKVRRLAVEKIEDTTVLGQIATLDADASVRHDARSRRFQLGSDPMREFVARALTRLPVAETAPEAAPEIRGSREEICSALFRDRRFRINGILNERDEAAEIAVNATAAGIPFPAKPRLAATARRDYLELLAAGWEGEGGASGKPRAATHYRVRIWRVADETFHAAAELRVVQPAPVDSPDRGRTGLTLAWLPAGAGSAGGG